MKILKHIAILVSVLVFSYFFSGYAGEFHHKLFREYGTWTDLRALVGFPLSYIFFLTLLFTAFGGEKKYWWMGTLLIPAAIAEFYLDPQRFYFPLALGLAGWALGLAAGKLIKVLRSARGNS